MGKDFMLFFSFIVKINLSQSEPKLKMFTLYR